jgi:hypothetical protein
MGQNVTLLGTWAFFGCKMLNSVTISPSIKQISDSAFLGCASLTSVTIPDGITKIGFEAFDFCVGLTSVTIPDSVTKIDDYAFFGCAALQTIKLPAHPIDFGNAVFAYTKLPAQVQEALKKAGYTGAFGKEF